MLNDRARAAVLACTICLVAGCTEPGAGPVGPAESHAAPVLTRYGAHVELLEFGPVPVRFLVPAGCLGGAALVSGAFSGQDRVVTGADGSVHVTQKLDVSNVTIGFGGELWTAGPNASEIFVKRFAADGTLRQAEHVGVVSYRAEDGRPALQFIHQIHQVRLPGGELQLNRQILGVRCIAPDR